MSRAPRGGRNKSDTEQLRLTKEGVDATKKGVRIAIWGLVVAVAIGVPGLIVTLKDSGKADGSTGPSSSPALVLTQAWPFITGCPPTSSKVAMPVGRGSIQQF